MRIVVLGGGRVGSAMARDLARGDGFTVTVADASAAALARFADAPGIRTVCADLGDPAALRGLVLDAELVVGAMPGTMGFQTVKTVLEAGRDIVDISFFAENPFLLDDLARERGVVAIVDCGVAPGCDNLILGHLATRLDSVQRFACYVGGLPLVRTWPWEYKAPFSPIDVIAEYTRPARYRAHGELVVMPALSEPELLDFAGVGTLEAFNTDGLRSLLTTIDVPFMVEKTLRYPGHIERIKVLRESGLLSETPVQLDGVAVRPLDLTARLLFPAWQLGPGEEDLTVMRVIVEGSRGGRRVRHAFDLLDRFDRATGTSSMARTTGYTCTAAVRAVARGLFTRKGISPPEFLGRQPECYDFILGELQARGVVFRETVSELA